MNGFEFTQGPFQDVEWLMKETDTLYATKIVPAGLPDKIRLTRDKMLEVRKWKPSLPLISKNFDQVLAETEVFYVPKVMEPGPAFVFPQRDVFGNYRRARLKPVGDWLLMKNEVVRYAGLGLKKEFTGPAWLGNSRQMIQRIINHQSVLLVEGVFDILAIMLLLPNIPVLSTGTNYLGWKHLTYLRMMGVRTIYPMFDQDPANAKGAGQGVEAMYSIQRKLEREKELGMKAIPQVCPWKDPSKALEDYRSAGELKSRLSTLF